MPVGVIVAASAASAVLAGFAHRRWFVVPLAAAVWPLYYLGLHAGWWGSGVGDGWAWAAALLTFVTAAGATAGVALGRATQQG